MAADSNKVLAMKGKFLTSDLVYQDVKARSLSFSCRLDHSCVGEELLEELLAVSREHNRTNARLCLHPSPEADFHEMIIVEYADRYYRPHKHLSKAESCHIIRGQIWVIVFNDNGEIARAERLASGGNLISRVAPNEWHTVLPATDCVIYHETKPGPFIRETDSIFAEWAPDGNDTERALQYTRWLKDHVGVKG